MSKHVAVDFVRLLWIHAVHLRLVLIGWFLHHARYMSY